MCLKLPKKDLEEICVFYAENDLNLEGSEFLITGATGFIGSWLTEALIALDLEFDLRMSITCLVRNVGKASRLFSDNHLRNLHLIETDLRHPQSFDRDFSHVIHAATPTSESSRAGDLDNIYSSSVLGSKNILSALSTRGNTPVFLHTSSGAVYGDQPLDLERIPLSSPMKWPDDLDSIRNLYAFSKLETERIVLEAHSQGKILGINARLFSFMGPRLPLDQHYAIGNFIWDVYKEGKVRVTGDGKSVRSYLHASNMAMQILYLLSEKISGASHVGSDEGRTLGEWAELVSGTFGAQIEILNEKSDLVTRYVPERDIRIPININSEEHYREKFISWMDWLNSRGI